MIWHDHVFIESDIFVMFRDLAPTCARNDIEAGVETPAGFLPL
jgi:hypothetical protein